MHFAWWQMIVLLMIVTTVTDFFNASLIDASMKYPIENARISKRKFMILVTVEPRSNGFQGTNKFYLL